ncbi:MAG TPA: HEAT repeat domain-containing protein [Prolixibacteraceae bacterium]|jgi:hypothetical protein
MTIDVKSKEILSNLKSTDPEIILKTIDKVRESGNSFILAGLIDLLHDTELPEIRKSVLDLLSELKNKESVPAFISAIKDDKYFRERKDLVACCWQNGLIYNEYLPLFIDLVINEDFQVAFEAFTVIENMFGSVDDEIIDKEILKVTEALKDASEQKAYLLNGLLSIIRDIPEKQEFTD